jgi:hypothetical protein
MNIKQQKVLQKLIKYLEGYERTLVENRYVVFDSQPPVIFDFGDVNGGVVILGLDEKTCENMIKMGFPTRESLTKNTKGFSKNTKGFSKNLQGGKQKKLF